MIFIGILSNINRLLLLHLSFQIISITLSCISSPTSTQFDDQPTNNDDIRSVAANIDNNSVEHHNRDDVKLLQSDKQKNGDRSSMLIDKSALLIDSNCGDCYPCAQLDMSQIDFDNDIYIEDSSQLLSTSLQACRRDKLEFPGSSTPNIDAAVAFGEYIGDVYCGGGHQRQLCVCSAIDNVCYRGEGDKLLVRLVPYCIEHDDHHQCSVYAIVINGNLTADINDGQQRIYRSITTADQPNLLHNDYLKIKNISCGRQKCTPNNDQ